MRSLAQLLIFSFWLTAVTAAPRISLKDAVNSALPGAAIGLEPTVYAGPENCDIQIQKDLFLASATSETIIDCLGASRCLTVSNGASVTIKGVTFKNGNAFSKQNRTIAASTSKRDSRRKLLLPVRRERSTTRHTIALQIVLTLDSRGRISSRHRFPKQRARTKAASAISRATTTPVPSVGGCVWVRESSSIVLRDVWMQNCTAQYGSGLGAEDSSVVISNTVFHQNGAALRSDLRGGAAYLFKCSARLVNVTASENYLRGSSTIGGAFSFSKCRPVLLQSVSAVSNTMLLSGASNVAEGGGFHILSCVDVSIQSTSAIKNTFWTSGSGYAGGFSFLTSTNISVESSSAVSNTFEANGDGWGGGFLFNNCKNVSIASSSAVGNKIASFGSEGYVYGGGYYFKTCNVRIQSSSAVGNSISSVAAGGSVFGGGLYFESCDSVSIESSSAVSNTISAGAKGYAQAAGGGYYLEGCDIVSIESSSAVNNAIGVRGSGQGGGYHLTGCQISVVIISSSAIGNSISLSGVNSYGEGAGFYVRTSPRVSIQLSSATSNAISSVVSSACLGGGYHFRTCGVSVSSSSAANNTLMGTNARGGGYYSFASTVLLADCSIFANRITSYLYVDTSSVYVPPPESTKGCAASTTITEPFGSITDGYNGTYPPNINCAWFIAPTLDAVYRLHVNITRLATEREYDFVYFYDGLSTFSRLIANLSGSDPVSSIVSTGPKLSIVFASDRFGSSYDGFRLTWRAEIAYDLSGAAGVLPQSLPSVFASGGGIYSELTPVSISRCRISYNSVTHPLLALGGAVYYMTPLTKSVVNTTFNDNTVTAIIAAGGALFTYEGLVVMSNNLFQNNTAVGTGWCYVNTQDGITRCPASFGGAIAVASGATARSEACYFSLNTATCLNPYGTPCSSNGAAISIGGAITIRTCICTRNLVSCSTALGCTRGAGGCLHGFATGTSSIVDSSLSSNRVSGPGIGGAMSIEATHTSTMNATLIRNNTAFKAGAISLADQSSLTLSRCYLVENVGETLAGAIATSGGISLTVVDSTVERNAASRLSSIVCFDFDNVALYTFVNTSFSDSISDGSSFLLLGRVNFVDNVFSTTTPGTVYSIDSSDSFFSITFTSCRAGTYSLLAASTDNNQTECFTCPFGAICHGADTIGNGLRAQQGYFGVRSELQVKFYPCPSGYCCNNGTGGCLPYDFCEGNRVGLLCGRCPAEMGLVFLSERCAPDADCKDAGWAFVVIIVVALGIIVYLVITTPRPASGIFSVLLFFYQVLPLVKSTPWQFTSPTVTTTLTSIFGMSLSSGQSGGLGICIVPSMTASQRLSARMVFQAVVLCAFFIQYVCHRSLQRLSFPWFSKNPPNGVNYFGAFIRFLTIAYTTLVLVPLQMLQCIEVSGRLVWWFDAEILCFDEPWQKAAIFAIAFLSPLPIVCSLMLFRWRKDSARLSDWQLEVRRVFTNGFAPNRRWWLGVSLLRRLLLVIVFACVRDKTWAAVINTILCTLFLFLNLRLRPFETPSTHIFETFSLTLLACLAASSSPALARLQYGTVENISDSDLLEWFQFIAAISPAVGFFFFLVVRGLRARFVSALRPTPETALTLAPDGGHVCSSCHLPYNEDLPAELEWGFGAMDTMIGLRPTCMQCSQFC